MIRTTVSWTFLCCFAFHSTAAEPSWTQWLGDGRDGVSAESGWSVDWPESGLPIAWAREIGIGFSSVSIADGWLFTMGHNDGEETVYCLNQENGETIWEHSYPSALVDNLYEGGPGATPTLDGDRIYTLGKEGQLICLDTNDGSVLWQRELQTDFEVELPEWGFNSSPTIVDRQLIVQGGRIASYDKTNGELLWKTPKHTPGYGAAEVFQQDGKTMLATLDSDGLRILDASNGKQIDAFPWPSPFRTNSTTPIFKDGTLYISTGYGVGCGKFRLTKGKLELIYDNREMRNHFNNSILYQGNLYGFDGNSNLGRVVQLVCMDHETGEVLWQQRGLGCGSLMIADGKLVLLSDDGQLVIAEATGSEYKELARAAILDGRCWTVPVLLDGHVYARNAQGRLVSVKLP
ncbi:Pyrrolo-quinoline quinone [Rhodopirellula maiorica SM1]|uniref:Pyrrolo-quinoline quinone n=1 Tax=Rhodopirellula maiorica SM1 TaxID=1265738 RepID=M5S5X4_9BACT|nr:PQQ-binding-like beta-propeller repeat protein [Rhodopirellula maiorica]EMI21599.1 Pyrrolo-quinoline quinone [Rhodopirellula maiorica SM1]